MLVIPGSLPRQVKDILLEKVFIVSGGRAKTFLCSMCMVKYVMMELDDCEVDICCVSFNYYTINRESHYMTVRQVTHQVTDMLLSRLKRQVLADLPVILVS